MDALGSTIVAAWPPPGSTPGQRAVRTGVYCLAGVDLPVDEDGSPRPSAPAAGVAPTTSCNDSLAVLRAGARSGWGVGVVCGSGLNCVGLGPDGAVSASRRSANCPAISPPGGSWLGVRALGLALRSRDGRGEPTALAELVPAHFGLPDPEAVLTAVYTGELDYGRLFELAQVCLDAAGAGDEVAAGAVGVLADEVVVMVTAAARRLGVADDEVEVVLGGGLFEGLHPGFVGAVESGVREVVPAAVFRRLQAVPVLGAALLGMDQVGAPEWAKEALGRWEPPLSTVGD